MNGYNRPDPADIIEKIKSLRERAEARTSPREAETTRARLGLEIEALREKAARLEEERLTWDGRLDLLRNERDRARRASSVLEEEIALLRESTAAEIQELRQDLAESRAALKEASRPKEAPEDPPGPADLPEEADRSLDSPPQDRAGKILSFLYGEDERPAEITMDHLLRTVLKALDHVREFPAQALDVVYSDDPGEYLRHHSHHVSRLALFLAWKMGCGEEAIVRAGLAGLLHDAGMAALPDGIILKHSSLTSEERAEVEAHAERGARLASSLEGMDEEIPEIIRLHHSHRDDPEASPDLSAGAQDLGRILALVDSYAALSAPRLYSEEEGTSGSLLWVVKDTAIVQTMDLPGNLSREEMDNPCPAVAMEGMLLRSPGRFEPEVAQALLNAMGPYPLGSCVEMEDGGVARVMALNEGDMNRPIVQTVLDPGGRKPVRPTTIDLRLRKDTKIKGPLSSVPYQDRRELTPP